MQTPKVEQTMISIKELKDTYYPDVDWVSLISSLMFSSNSKAVIKEEQMVVTNPTFITKFKNLMEKTPSRTVANLIGFTIMINPINKDVNAFDILLKSEIGNLDFKECAKFLSAALLFNKAAEALYVKKHFSPEQKKEIFNGLMKLLKQKQSKKLIQCSHMLAMMKKY